MRVCIVQTDNLAENLLKYLRKELDDKTIRYKTPPETLEGGQESYLYTFQLDNAPNELSQRQVLRVYPPYAKNSRAHREGIVQKHLNEKGYPTPKIPFICSNLEPLGRPFIIMEYLEGQTLGDYVEHDWDLSTQIIYEPMLKLQQIDPEPLRKQYQGVGIPEKDFTWLCQYTDFANAHQGWISPALEWIIDNKPKPVYAICHGDYHWNNIIVDSSGVVQGVLDWVNVSIDDPIRDLASSHLGGIVFGPRMWPDRKVEFEYRLGNSLEYYRSRVDFDDFKFDYFQAHKCLMVMLAYEYGVEFYGRFGIINATTRLFEELTGVPIEPKRG